MTATVVPIERASGRGRQPAEVEALRDARDDLTALLAETTERYARVLAATRRAQVNLALGRYVAGILDDIERDVLRGLNQVTAATAEAEPICPDGETARHIGHGKAA